MSGSAEAEIEQLFGAYVDAINRQDVAAVARLYSYPAMMGGIGHPPMTVPDEAAYRQIIEATLGQFRERGWSRTGIDRVQAVATAGDTGFVAADFSRYRSDGSVVDRGSALYAVVRREGRWSMIAAMGA
jgi:ketosteroid isomerase-like protein